MLLCFYIYIHVALPKLEVEVHAALKASVRDFQLFIVGIYSRLK